MVQSVNTKAILTLASIVRRPGLLVPHLSVANVSEVNYTALKEVAGIRALVFDKVEDNTLTPPYDNSLHPAAAPGLERAIQVFGPDMVAILSNSAGTRDDPDYADALKIEESLGISVIRHEEKKPGGLDEVLSHFHLDDPATVCVVGDRVLTDVVFGNLYGLLTIHTLPLCEGTDNESDNWTAKLLRPMENSLLYGKWFRNSLSHRRLTHKYWDGSQPTALLMESTTPEDRASPRR